MPTLYIMVGVGFSGKSTLAQKIAKRLDVALVSQDGMFFEKEKELNIDQDSDEQWRMLLDMCLERISELLKEGKSVVFDNVNLQREDRSELRRAAQQAGAKAVVVYLDTPEEILAQRQEENKVTGERHDVKQEYLDDAKKQLEVPGNDENAFVYSPKTNLETFLAQLPR